jgi:hypothetical protein
LAEKLYSLQNQILIGIPVGEKVLKALGIDWRIILKECLKNVV